MKKQIYKLTILMLIITLVCPINVFAGILTDVSTSEFKIEIEKLVEDGTITGYNDGTFRPLNNISRSELSAVLVRVLKLEEDPDSAKHFVDVDGKWNQGYIGALYKAGIFKGKSQTTFAPDDNVTRQELAVILIRIFGLEEIALELKLESDMVDFNEIPDWAKYSVSFANKIDLMNGIESEDGTILFEGTRLANRELTAKLVHELKYNKENYEVVINSLVENNVESSSTDKPVEENKDESKDKPSYDSIVSRYMSRLTSLEASAHQKANSLMEQAKAEYEANKNNPDFSASALYEKYLSIAEGIEAQIDGQVSSILSSLESELSSNGYDTSAVDDLYSQYESAKGLYDF